MEEKEELKIKLKRSMKYTLKHKDLVEGYLHTLSNIFNIKKKLKSDDYLIEELLCDFDFIKNKNNLIIKKLAKIKYQRIVKNRNKICYFIYKLKRKIL